MNLRSAPTSGQTRATLRAAELRRSYIAVRRATEDLASPLSPEDCVVQSMPDASPIKWHLAHTSWFFETFVLESALPRYERFHPRFRVLFNSYYNTVGMQHARAERGLLTRPSLEHVRDYRAHVDRCVERLLAEEGRLDSRLCDVVELGLHHEQQHQELMLTDVKHLLGRNPLRPAYRDGRGPAGRVATALRWHARDATLADIGHDGRGFAFDNEGPRHRVHVGAFELASRPVTNGEYLEFLRDEGYARPEHWLSDGWGAVQTHGWRAPLYWEERDGTWWIFTLGGERELHPDEPVCHLSYYEADAYARWAAARLPTEFEWEVVAREAPVDGNFVESGRLHPAPAASGTGDGAPQQLFGDVWEWTSSAYGAYPGYRVAPGALGEYNGKFMCNQLVLRGGSCVTPGPHVRATYRNFFPPAARWQVSGFRLARDAA